MIIEIFRNYFLILGIELIPMLTGLISSLLSGAEEQDEKIQNMINDLLFQINLRVGDKYYISTLWSLLLKNSKNRIATFKVLLKKFAEFNPNFKPNKPAVLESVEPNLQEIYEKINETNGKLESFYSNTLMISNAFAMCIEDDDISTRKNCLDFIIKYIDLNNDELFDDSKKLVIFESLIKILDVNDLSIVRRMFKMLFDANDLNSIETSQKNKRMIYFLAKGFLSLLAVQHKTSLSIQKPFKILVVLHKSNEFLTREMLKQIAMPFADFMFQNGYHRSTDFNHIIVELTKSFIKDFDMYLEDFLEAINKEIQQSPLYSNELLLIEFVMKVLVSESNISLNSKFRFMIGLMDSIFQQLDKHFEKQLAPLKRMSFSALPEETSGIVKTRRLEKIIQLLSQCTLILENMLKTTKITIDVNLKKRISDLLVKDSALLETILEDDFGQTEILDNYSKIYSVLMEIDALQNAQNPPSMDGFKFENLPKWLQCQFRFLQSKKEILSYSALNFLYSLLDYEKKWVLIANYNQFIYKTKRHFEKDGICWVVMTKIVDMIEIYDFKKLALKFLAKMTIFNFGFTCQFFLIILNNRRAEDFNKIALIWNATSASQVGDSRLVLQETVFEMLSFIEIKDLMITHYFKSWLNQSNDNLTIVLQTVLKGLIKYTSWNFSENDVVYKVPFDCDKFIQSLNCLIIVYENSTYNFLNYIIKTKIPIEFEFYDEEMTIILKNYFQSDETVFLVFILKIFLRYIVGFLDRKIGHDKIAEKVHIENVHRVKEAIVIFLEKLLRSMEKMDIIKTAIIPMVRIFAQLIETAFVENKTILQITYLNFLEFLVFKTGMVNKEVYKDDVYAIITNSRIMPCFLLSLKSNSYYVVKEFVRFGCELNFLLAKFLKYPVLFKEVNQVVFFYLDSIIGRCEQGKSLKEEEQQKEIITELMYGLKMCLGCFLQVDEIEERIRSSPIEQAFLTVFTLGIIQPKDEIKKKIAFIKDENTSKHLLNSLEKIFSMLCVCWKKVGLVDETVLFQQFDPNAFILPQDDKNVIGISKQVIEIVKPLAGTFLEATVESFIENWIANNDIGDNGRQEMNVSLFENSKILEIILSMQIAPIRVLFSLLNGKQMRNLQSTKRYNQYKKEKDLIVVRKVLTYECSFLSFIFAYLKFLNHSEPINFELHGIMIKIFKQFENSTSPTTLCWILDIISLLIDKYPIDFTQYSTLKTEYITLLSDLLSKSIKVILKDTVLSYRETDKPFRMIFPQTPTIDEYLFATQKKISPKNKLETNESRLKS